MRLSNILNYRSVTKELPNSLWAYAPFHADFQPGHGFTIDQTFKKLQIDSIYSYEKDKRLSVIQYTHLKPNLKTSGFGLATEWRGKIIFDPDKMEIRSHFKELHFKKNEDYGLYHISFDIEYFNYQGFVFPRIMITSYQFKNKDGSVRNGKGKILITDIELENPQKPINRIWEYEKATSDIEFWKTFNTILVEEK